MVSKGSTSRVTVSEGLEGAAMLELFGGDDEMSLVGKNAFLVEWP